MEEKIKNKIEQKCGFDPFTIMMITSLVFQLLKILWACRGGQKFVKNAAKRNGLVARLFLSNKVIPQLVAGGMSQEQAQDAAEKLRQMLAEDEFDDFDQTN